MIKPPALKTGDTLGIVAPAGVVNPRELEVGIKRLEGLGFRVRVGGAVRQAFRTMAGADRERAQDLLQMFSDPEIKGIVCARGGYGSARVIPFLDRDLIRAHPKIFVGSSDITVLLLYLTQECGLVAFHGPMVGPNFGKDYSPLTETFFLKILTQPGPIGPIQLSGVRILKNGRAEGRLMGGCLSLLCSAIGTPYDPQTDGAVLFLEDIREPPYRIDRMLTQLKAAGKFRKVRGVLFGGMWGCQPDDEAGYRLEDVILDVLDDLDGPVLFGIPSGHGEVNITLPLGIRIRVSASPAEDSETSSSSSLGRPGLTGEGELLNLEEAAISITPADGVSGG